MTYILDLQQLWNDRSQVTLKSAKAAYSLALDPKQHVVSVVLLANYKQEDHFLEALQAIVSQWFIREIIVICPEGFTLDRHLEKFSHTHPRCYGIPAKKSISLAEAYNLGAKYASGQFLLFMDSQILLQKNAVFKLLATGIRKSTPWVVGVKTGIDKRFSKVISKLTNFYSSYSLNDATMVPEVSLPGGGIHTLNIASSGFLMPIKTFVELKGMDQKCSDNIFHLDLCLRIHLAGGSVYEVQEVEIEKSEKRSVSKLTALYEIFCQEWKIFRATCYFYQKYVSKETNFMWIAIRYLVLAFQALGRCTYRTIRHASA